MVNENFFLFNNNGKLFDLNSLNKDVISLEEIENKIKDIQVKNKIKNIFAKYDKDGSNSLEKNNSQNIDEIQSLIDDLKTYIQSDEGADKQVFEEGEMRAFLGTDLSDSKSIDALKELVNILFKSDDEEDVKDNEEPSVIAEEFIDLESKNPKKTKGQISSNSFIGKSIVINNLPEEFRQIARSFNKQNDNNADILDGDELKEFWQKILEMSKKGVLKEKDLKNFLSNMGIETNDLQKNQLYDFLNILANQGNKVESSTVEVQDGKSVIVINYIAENGMKITERHYDNGDIETITTNQETNVVSTIVKNKDDKILKQIINDNNTHIETIEYELDDYYNSVPKQRIVEETYTDNGDEVHVTKINDKLVKKVIKHTIPENDFVTVTTIDYEGGVPKSKSIATESGIILEDFSYIQDNYLEQPVTRVTQSNMYGNTISQSIVSQIDENGDWLEQDFIERSSIILEDTILPNGMILKPGSTYDVVLTNGYILEVIVDSANNRSIMTQYKTDSISEFDNSGAPRLIQTVIKDGKEYNIFYDGEGNTYIPIKSGDGFERITREVNSDIDKYGLDDNYHFIQQELEDLNPKAVQRGLIVGDYVLVPGEYFSDSGVVLNRGTVEDAIRIYSNYASSETLNRLYTSTINEYTLDKTYTSYEQLAREMLIQQGVTSPTSEQVNNRALELITLNSSKSLTKGTTINIVGKQANKEDVDLLVQAGFELKPENQLFYLRFNELDDNQRQQVLDCIKNYCEDITDLHNIKSIILNLTGINLFDSGLVVGGAGSNSSPWSELEFNCNLQRGSRKSVSIEEFIIDYMKIDLNSPDGKDIYNRLLSLDQETLNTININNFLDLNEKGQHPVEFPSLKTPTFYAFADEMSLQGIPVLTQNEMNARVLSEYCKLDNPVELDPERERVKKNQFLKNFLIGTLESAYKLIYEHSQDIYDHPWTNAGEVIFDFAKTIGANGGTYLIESVIGELPYPSFLSAADKSLIYKGNELYDKCALAKKLDVNSPDFEKQFKELFYGSSKDKYEGEDIFNELYEISTEYSRLHKMNTLYDNSQYLQNTFGITYKDEKTCKDELDRITEKLMNMGIISDSQDFISSSQFHGFIGELIVMTILTEGLGDIALIQRFGSAAGALTKSEMFGRTVSLATAGSMYCGGREGVKLIDDFSNDPENFGFGTVWNRVKSSLKASSDGFIFTAAGCYLFKPLATLAQKADNLALGQYCEKGISFCSKKAKDFYQKYMARPISGVESQGAMKAEMYFAEAEAVIKPVVSQEGLAKVASSLNNGVEISGINVLKAGAGGNTGLGPMGMLTKFVLDVCAFSAIDISLMPQDIIEDCLSYAFEAKDDKSCATRFIERFKERAKNLSEDIVKIFTDQTTMMGLMQSLNCFRIGARGHNLQFESVKNTKVYVEKVGAKDFYVVETESGKIRCNTIEDVHSLLYSVIVVESGIRLNRNNESNSVEIRNNHSDSSGSVPNEHANNHFDSNGSESNEGNIDYGNIKPAFSTEPTDNISEFDMLSGIGALNGESGYLTPQLAKERGLNLFEEIRTKSGLRVNVYEKGGEYLLAIDGARGFKDAPTIINYSVANAGLGKIGATVATGGFACNYQGSALEAIYTRYQQKASNEGKTLIVAGYSKGGAMAREIAGKYPNDGTRFYTFNAQGTGNLPGGNVTSFCIAGDMRSSAEAGTLGYILFEPSKIDVSFVSDLSTKHALDAFLFLNKNISADAARYSSLPVYSSGNIPAGTHVDNKTGLVISSQGNTVGRLEMASTTEYSESLGLTVHQFDILCQSGIQPSEVINYFSAKTR